MERILERILKQIAKRNMIPLERFGDIRVTEVNESSVVCNLNSLYKGGIKKNAGDKEFCYFLLVEFYKKLSLYNHPVMSWNGDISKQKAKELFHNLDKTSHLFFKESKTLLEGIKKAGNEDRFKVIAQKIIENVILSKIIETEGTFKECAILEFKMSNSKLIDHIAEGALIEY